MSERLNRKDYFRRYNAARSEKTRLYFKANRNRINARNRARRRADLEKVRNYDRKRYAIKKLKGTPITPEQMASKMADSAARAALYKREWRLKNRDRVLEQQRQWRDRNRERERLRAAKFRAGSPEASREISRRYNRIHPDIARLRTRRRRARIIGATIGNGVAIATWETKWRRKSSVKCFWCCQKFPPSACHSDHIVPLTRGGTHSVENLTIACAGCNQRKYNKLPNEWSKTLEHPVLL